jgi:hypothetical protein
MRKMNNMNTIGALGRRDNMLMLKYKAYRNFRRNLPTARFSRWYNRNVCNRVNTHCPAVKLADILQWLKS